MSMCRVFSCVIGRGCLLWPVHSLGKIPLAFDLLHFVLQGQICLLLQISLDFLNLHSSPLQWKGPLFGVLILEGLIVLHRTVQLPLFQHYWSGRGLGSLWHCMVCLGNEQTFLQRRQMWNDAQYCYLLEKCKSRLQWGIGSHRSEWPSSKILWRASLVVQWLRVCLATQGTPVQFLVWEDPTSHEATKPGLHNWDPAQPNK